MDKDFYQSLEDLAEIFSDCSIEGEQIWCFEFIKKIINGELVKENIDKELKISMQEQLKESLEWLQSLGIKTKYQKEFLEIIN